MNHRLFLTLLLFLNLYSCITAQVIPDTLLQKSNKELLKAYDLFKEDIYIQAYLKKAKISNDTTSIVNAYNLLSNLYNGEASIKYSDSIIALTENSPNTMYPAYSYLTKGQAYFFKVRKMKAALDNLLLADKYARQYYNKEIIFGSNHMIGLLKDRIGYSEEALQIHIQNLEFAEKNYEETIKPVFTSISIHAIAYTYKNLEQLDSALYYNNLGIEKASNLKTKKIINHLFLNEGVIYYHTQKLEDAKKSIKKAIKYFEKIDDKPNKAESYFYLAKIYRDLNQEEKAISYLQKIDSIFIQTNDLLPEIREGYEILINHYKEKENTELQLLYLERLISLDSVLSSNKSYLSDNLKSKYDIPKLIKAKEILIAKLKKDKINLKYIFIGILILLIIIIIGLFLRQKKFEQKFNAIIEQDSNIKKPELTAKTSIVNNENLEVPQYIAMDILKQLETFENNQEFTDKKITLLSLAKSYNTNSTYLSKTINHYYNKSFTNYINDLRIEHALVKLKDSSSFRRYTIKAIAHDTGFKSAETFSKLFMKKNGIYPSYFIKKMEAFEKQTHP
ncbi:helix-turn-helix domain-containing protein [Aquimarina algiphila]|uniref:helix-turn-helix domain-containing protein n=1 Tax=Aquimarina algiphila TaxID=2047982 RepID=UPI00232BE149|nr:helix-turn-helix domain-containing protein [Aquimarina algiphila]